MFDGVLRRSFDPAINAMAKKLVRRCVSAEQVTFAGLIFGLGAAAAIAFGWPLGVALAGLALSRLADGLDGAVARLTSPTGRGAFFDILCDFVFYGAMPLAFALDAPETNALPAAVLLFAFYINGASFLGFAAVAAGQGMTTEQRGTKGLYYTAGLAEGAETILCFLLMILFPAQFPWLAYGFALLCGITTVSRAMLAWDLLGRGGR